MSSYISRHASIFMRIPIAITNATAKVTVTVDTADRIYPMKNNICPTMDSIMSIM